MDATGFNLSSVFKTVTDAIPDQTVLLWRGRRLTYGEMDARVDGVARYLSSIGLGCHTERVHLQGHESGQDHLGIYLRNGNEYLEAMIGSYRARVAPFNVSYRYVEDELVYLLADAHARALVYHAEFAPRVAAMRDKLPHLEVLIQVDDGSGNALLRGAVDYESITSTPEPHNGMPTPRTEDLYILYTGGTTGMPKGVLWRQHDIYMSSMGGRPFGGGPALASHSQLVEQAKQSAGAFSLLMIAPFMHGAGQWAAFTLITQGGWMVIPDDVERLRPDAALRLAEQERITSIPLVGDAIARPLLDEIETGTYDLSGLIAITNGGAPLSPSVRDRILNALPHVLLVDAVGSSESGVQMNAVATKGPDTAVATFTPPADTAVISDDFARVLGPGEGEGWLARYGLIPLGYLGDEDKTARTYPTISGVRWSVPGDRANMLSDGRIQLLGRDAVSINSGGEKIFVEEVERAIAGHPDVYDVVVVGRPSERWGSEVVAIVQLTDDATPDHELTEICEAHIARYKIPKAFIRVAQVVRSPAGKADYRWAKRVAAGSVSAIVDPTARGH
jgi:fatty-acyl-CoA synthase